MSWPEVKIARGVLAKARNDGEPMIGPWKSFADVVKATESHPPFHLRTLLDIVAKAGDPHRKSDVMILDHGCGGAGTLLYLCAMGYTGIHGIDLDSSDAKRWNRLLREVFDIQEDRFFSYDGGSLPFSDNTFDIIFSQQVLEHVRPNVIDTYYAEEYRILKPGGSVFHQVPHRLVPYDSHTRTWFLHYLPHPVWRLILRLLGKSSITTETALFLRWPWEHRGKIGAQFDDTVDLTVDRLVDLDDYSYYDGPVRLRRAITALVRTPLIGPVARAALKNLVMIDTVSQKTAHKNV